jgi:hypothetical protein
VAIPSVAANDFEFIELVNIGTSPLSLGGASFSNGVTFTFPAGFTLAAGARTLVVSNLAAFQLRYPGLTNIAGVYTGHLDNSGEEVTLLDGAGEVVLDFTYDPAWQPLAATGGYSLTAASETQDYTAWNSAAGWKPSGKLGGTPGAVDMDFDTDGDGLPDLWESQHGLDPRNPTDAAKDSDGDGVSNLAEYQAGTDPQDPRSYFRIDSIARAGNGDMHIVFTAAANRSYAVQRSSNLVAWSPVQTVPTGSARSVETVDDAVAAQPYYRVVTPAP